MNRNNVVYLLIEIAFLEMKISLLKIQEKYLNFRINLNNKIYDKRRISKQTKKR